MSSTSTTPGLSVSLERQPGSLVELTIEAPAQDVDAAVQAALRVLARRVRIPGFRPGKAPAAIVERTLGWEVVRQEAVEQLIPGVYARALDQENIDPVGDPSIDLKSADVERGKALTFTAKVVVRPEVDLGEYLAIRVPEPTTELTDEQVDARLEEVRQQHSTLEKVDRPAQLGDVLRCTLKMTRDEEILSGDSGEERDLELDPTKLLPGLAESTVGLEAGATKTFPITLPEDFQREDLRNQTVSVDVAVSEVRQRVLPPLDDELAKLDKHGSTAEEMRSFYRGLLAEQAEREMTQKFESDVLTALSDSLTVDIPEIMINAEIDRQLRELEFRFSSMGISWEQYLQYSGETMEKLRGERRESAVQRVKLELALDAVAAAEGLEVDEAAVVREEKRIGEGRKLTAEQKRRLHAGAHVDLRRQGAAQRMLEIARGEV